MTQKPLSTFVNQTPKCLVEIDASILDGVDRSEYDSYVYIYEVLSGPFKGWVYIGYHKLSKNEIIQNNSYSHNSTNQDFINEWDKGTPIKKTILSIGSKKEMKNLEREQQDEYEKNGYNLFNKIKAGRGWRDILFEEPEIRKLIKRAHDSYLKLSKNLIGKNPDDYSEEELIELGWDRDIYDKPKLSPISDFEKSEKMQIRTNDDSINYKNIKNRIDDKGDWTNTDFILFSWIWDEKNKKWYQVVNDGNTTGKALVESKIKYFKCLSFKKEFIVKNGICSEVLEHVGRVFNKKNREYKPNSKQDIIQKFLIPRYKKGIPLDSITNITILQDDYEIHSGTVTKWIGSAKCELEEQKRQLELGKKVINYDMPDRSHLVDKKVEELSRNNVLVVVATCTSPNPAGMTIMKEIFKNPNISSVKVIIKYNTYENYKNYHKVKKVKKSEKDTFSKKQMFEEVIRDYVTNQLKSLGSERIYETIYMDLDEDYVTQ